MKTYITSIIDFIFPKTSIISGKRLNDNNSNQYISDDEIELIDRVSIEDLIDLKKKLISDSSFALFAFREEDDFSKVIYQLKYGGMKLLGVYLGTLFGKELKKNILQNNLLHFDIIIPVPLFKTKIRERGYNQSDFICLGISETLGIKSIPDIVVRNRHTSTQTTLNREQRIENMKDAFEINGKYKNQIEEKKIILVDDVVTTGSTMNEVIKVLKENRCGEVLACCLAMAR